MYIRAHSRFAPSQLETSLQSNAVSHWLSANLESVLYMIHTSCGLGCNIYHRKIMYTMMISSSLTFLKVNWLLFHIDFSLMSYHIYFPMNSVSVNVIRRVDSRFAPSQWETALFCNDVSHWLGTNLESALISHCPLAIFEDSWSIHWNQTVVDQIFAARWENGRR